MSHQYLNGVTLETILNELVSEYGWQKLSKLIEIRCFYNEPSINLILAHFCYLCTNAFFETF
jgi:uncharacterized protein (DUF2132 family)